MIKRSLMGKGGHPAREDLRHEVRTDTLASRNRLKANNEGHYRNLLPRIGNVSL